MNHSQFNSEILLDNNNIPLKSVYNETDEESNIIMNISDRKKPQEISLQLLKNIKTILDIAGTRSCFKTNEMLGIGVVYNELDTIIKSIENQ